MQLTATFNRTPTFAYIQNDEETIEINAEPELTHCPISLLLDDITQGIPLRPEKTRPKLAIFLGKKLWVQLSYVFNTLRYSLGCKRLFYSTQ